MNLPPNFIRCMIFDEFHKGSDESQAVKNICTRYGKGILKKAECQTWYARFKAGDVSLEETTENEKVETKGKTVKRELHDTSAEDKAIVAKKQKKTPIEIAADVYLLIFGWIKLKELPNITLTSRRLWQICNVNLDGRRRCINELRVTTIRSFGRMKERIVNRKEPFGLIINRKDKDTLLNPGLWQSIPFAEDEPPKKFTMGKLCFHAETYGKYDTASMQFLRVSKPLLENARLIIRVKKSTGLEKFNDELLACFDNCISMRISFNSTIPYERLHELLTKTGILNFARINVKIYARVPEDHSYIDSVFNWLHTRPTSDPKARRQISFYNSYTSASGRRVRADHNSYKRLKNKFLTDQSAHTFLIRIDGHKTCVEIDLENCSTGEVFFTRKVTDKNGREKDAFELVRCSKEEKESIKFEELGSTARRVEIQ